MKGYHESLVFFKNFVWSKQIVNYKECFLYSFSFKEDCYLIACKNALREPKIGTVFKGCSIISSKRMIDRMRAQNYSEIFYSESD
jgi:predicted amidohydrolase